MARHGIDQFTDLGCGVPLHPRVRPATRETAQAVLPGARVAYVDKDEMAVLHSRVLLGSPGCAAVLADISRPAAVMADPGFLAAIDPARPVCVLLCCVLGCFPAGQARKIVAGYARRLPSGSAVVLSSAYVADPALSERLACEYTAARWVNPPPGDVRLVLRAAAGPGGPAGGSGRSLLARGDDRAEAAAAPRLGAGRRGAHPLICAITLASCWPAAARPSVPWS